MSNHKVTVRGQEIDLNRLNREAQCQGRGDYLGTGYVDGRLVIIAMFYFPYSDVKAKIYITVVGKGGHISNSNSFTDDVCWSVLQAKIGEDAESVIQMNTAEENG